MADAGSYATIVVLICLSALFSGLTLGLMGLDQMGLKIVIESGSREEASTQEKRDARYAKAIQPFRERGNLLLCTLLFGNVAVNSMLSILMADLTSGLMGLVISTIVIVIFGEIMPQSVCSRHPLAIGSACIPLVYLFVVLTFIASYPTSLILDKVLGEEIGTIYSRNQLKNMLQMYAQMTATDMNKEETDILTSALDFQKKVVGDCMTKIDDVFMLDIEDTLTLETIMRIFESGHSRVPVYKLEDDAHNDVTTISEGERIRRTPEKKVVGLLFIKELIPLDPEDALPVSAICHHWFGRDIPVVFDDCPTNQVMRVFKSGRSHMALVKSVVTEGDGDPYYRTVGIVTLEDLIEEILGDEIYDEQDIQQGSFTRKAAKEDLSKQIAGGAELPVHHPLLKYLEAKERKERVLPKAEVEAVASFLKDRFIQLFGEQVMSRLALESLIQTAHVQKFDPKEAAAAGEGAGEAIYARGEATSKFTLVLEGEIRVQAGEDGFACIKGPWDVFGQRVLATHNQVVPDFTAVIEETRPARLLQIDLAKYLELSKSSKTRRPMRLFSPKLQPSSPSAGTGPMAGEPEGSSLHLPALALSRQESTSAHSETPRPSSIRSASRSGEVSIAVAETRRPSA